MNKTIPIADVNDNGVILRNQPHGNPVRVVGRLARLTNPATAARRRQHVPTGATTWPTRPISGWAPPGRRPRAGLCMS